MSGGWIGVDLDGTLAMYEDWVGPEHIGAPIPLMMARVKAWLEAGQEVRIYTARVGGNRPFEANLARSAIKAWCIDHIGQELEVTCCKDYGMIECWDDRAVQVIPNTGRTIADATLSELTALTGKP